MKKFTTLLALLNVALFIKLGYLTTILSGNSPLQDFDAYMALLKEARGGVNPYDSSLMQTLGPPLVFSYYLPLIYITLTKARILTSLVNLLCGFGMTAILAKRYFKNTTGAFLALNLLLFSAFPVRFSLEMGQTNLVLAFLLTLVTTNKNEKIKSAFLAVLISFKTFYVFLTLVFFKRKKQIFIYSLAVTGVIFLLFLPLIKFEWYQFFLTNKLYKFFEHPDINSLNYYNQSVSATLVRFGIVDQAFLIQMLLAIFLSIQTVISGSLVLGVITSLVASPVAWQHYFVILFPLFVYAYKSRRLSQLDYAILIMSVFLWWVEFSYLHSADMNLFNRLLASHYIVSALLLIKFI